MHRPAIEADVLRRWLELSRAPQVDGALAALHDRVATRVAASRPVCTASARCCDFARAGHDLFVTGLEAAWTLDRIPAARALTARDIASAEARGVCPFLVYDGGIGRCGVHPARPAGCRVYFCDPTRAGFVGELAESAASEVRALHDRFGVPYVYAEWRWLLGRFAAEGIAAAPSRPIGFVAADPFVAVTRGATS
jgi:hypothetical protein